MVMKIDDEKNGRKIRGWDFGGFRFKGGVERFGRARARAGIIENLKIHLFPLASVPPPPPLPPSATAGA